MSSSSRATAAPPPLAHRLELSAQRAPLIDEPGDRVVGRGAQYDREPSDRDLERFRVDLGANVGANGAINAAF
jgi:hypothetical protein